MRTSEADILIIPGLGGSGPDHWQSRWQAKLPTARRVNQDDWDRPQLESWRDQIIAQVAAAGRPVILVAHSLGAMAVAHAAAALDSNVRGAFLVAPVSPRIIAGIETIDPRFVDVPMTPLPFRSVLVASRDDPYSEFGEAEHLAQSWQAEMADAGNAGHINAESGHGPWPEGLMRFASFLKGL